MLKTLYRYLLPTSTRKRIRSIGASCVRGLKIGFADVPCSGFYSTLGLLLHKWGYRGAANFICLILLAQNQKKVYAAPPLTNPLQPKAKVCPLRLSVIIPTYNRADMLPALFDSLRGQTLSVKSFEVVVVNNNSSDNTENICAAYAPFFPNFRVIHEKAQSLLSARHAGWRAAATDILVFCDDDIEAFPTWLETIDSLFLSDPKVGLVGGNNVGKFDTPLPTWFANLWCAEHGIRINTWYSLLEGISKPMVAPSPTFVFGCNYSIRRQALEVAQGFEPDCMQHVLFQGGGETGITSNLAKDYKIMLHPGASVYHRMHAGRLTPAYMWRRAIYFMAEALYTAFRGGSVPAQNLIDQQKLQSVGINEFSLATDFGSRYTEAILRFSTFRDWIMSASYLGHEDPPSEVLAWAQAHVPHSTWHGETS